MTMPLNSFCDALGIETLPIGVYDAPDPELFVPVVPLKRCIFDHYQDFQSGAAVILDPTAKGCPGCGYWMLGKMRFPSRGGDGYVPHRQGRATRKFRPH